MSTRFVGLATLALFCAAPAAAQEGPMILGGGELDLRFPRDGTTQELQVYLEAERSGFYAGFQGLVFNDSTLNEISLYAGYRRELDNGFSYDVFYARYFHPNDGGDCCGNIGLSFGVAVGERLGLTTDLTYDPERSLGSVEIGAEHRLTDKLALSANFGLFQQEEGPDEKIWDLGVIYGLSDEARVELRYYDGSEIDKGYLGLLLTFDTELTGG